MNIPPIAVQLYTIREQLRTRKDLAATLKQIKKIGYDYVETGELEVVSATEYASILDGESLSVCGFHSTIAPLIDKTDEMIERMNILQCPYICCAWLGEEYRSKDGCKKAGVKYYIVEQDVCRRPPLESIKISFDNLHAPF